MAYEMKYAKEAGPNCRLAQFMANNDDVGRPWTLGDIYCKPLRDVLTELIAARLNAARDTIDKPLSVTKKFILPGFARDAIAAINGTDRPWLSRTMEELMVSREHVADNHDEATDGTLLNVLRQSGVYIPLSHVGIAVGDADRLRYLFGMQPYNSLSLWDHPFPDPEDNVLKPLRSMTFGKLFCQKAAVVVQQAPQTFSILQVAKDLGVLRPNRNRKHTVNPRGGPPPAFLPAPYVFNQGGNRKCCLNGVCNTELAQMADYCEQVSGGGCSAMSDPC
ncbi:MAG: hypothetical protein SGI88_02540 [Candidatus Hydrogenedentes bacterium]|nr:hypothetical protein [Candidatus Hydrogenedentota bacterium]